MTTFRDYENKAIAKAWKDPAYKKKLLSHPKEALKEVGAKIPEDVEIHIVEDTAKKHTMVLPLPPAHMQGLSSEELAKLAGGTGCGPLFSEVESTLSGSPPC